MTPEEHLLRDIADTPLDTRNYTEPSVSCAICNAKLNERELRLLRADTDFVPHGKDLHLIRVEPHA